MIWSLTYTNNSLCWAGMRVGETMKSSKKSESTDQCGMVISSQRGVHPQLEKHLRRHLQSRWSQPLHKPTLDTFRHLQQSGVLAAGLPVILDSGCGTGSSSFALAQMYPNSMVIGVDQSLARLSKNSVCDGFFQKDNCVLVRAELSAFWRLLLNTGVSIERHYLLYPNPWPKAAHLKRRWHGHPVFPFLLALGGTIELRCNWKIYAQEFAQAVNYVMNTCVTAVSITPESGISPFEQKYLARHQTLYAVNVPTNDSPAFRTGGWRSPLVP